MLNASGSGYNTDVSNGINKAVAAGAGVINLSLTYMATPDIVAAINNAAAKGAFIVWAGGNEARALLANANTLGLTQNAINHLIFAGALDTTAAKSATFSNTPGTGSLVSTTGAKTRYAARWIDAPGVNILAPGITYGPSAMALWSGTSMSAPLVSGSLTLLQSAWPILKTNGTTANLLLSTATDLGAVGVDAIYGTGRVNLTKAFQPVGSLTVTQANGRTATVSSLTKSMITGGALGSMPTVQTKLANFTAFDSYARNFGVNLSGLIQTKPTAAQLNPLPNNVNRGVVVMKLDGGGYVAVLPASADNPFDRMGLTGSVDGTTAMPNSYLALTSAAGATFAMGYGVPNQLSYARAAYGSNGAAADFAALSGDLNVASLSDLAQGGYNVAYGMPFGSNARVAVAYSQTVNVTTNTVMSNSLVSSVPAGSSASNAMLGVTYKFNEQWTGGATLGLLGEQSGLLGSSYQTDSALSLGDNRTTSFGFSLGYAFDERNSLLAEAGLAYTKGGEGSGLLAGTSEIQSRSFGFTFQSKQIINKGDRFAISLKQPLRVVSGDVGVVSASVDELGIAHYNTDSVSLVPDGREIDLKFAYDTPIGKTQSLSLQVTATKDAQNVAGERDASIGAIWSARF